jgi:hypothetical protein
MNIIGFDNEIGSQGVGVDGPNDGFIVALQLRQPSEENIVTRLQYAQSFFKPI